MSDFKLHTIYTPAHTTSNVDIVFIHGLGGDFAKSWTKTNSDGAEACWPKWLAEKFSSATIWFLQYPSSQLSSLFGGTDMSLITAASGVAELLRAHKIGTRPLVLIAHSLGGIIIKAVLRNCSGSAEQSKKAVFESCVGAIFFGTPHTGSGLSSIFAKVPKVPSLQATELARADSVLIELYDWYRNATQDGCIRSKAFYETLPTNGAVVVDAGSANPGVTNCDPSPINSDHIGMCKFADESASEYISVVTFLEELFSTHTIGINENISIDDLEYYLSNIPDDRKSLEEKLQEGGRHAELKAAELEKERLAKIIRRDALSSSARKEYRDFLGEVLTRFRLHVAPLIRSGQNEVTVNQAIEKHVIAPLSENGERYRHGNYADIHSAIYYLTGNCHIDWTNSDV